LQTAKIENVIVASARFASPYLVFQKLCCSGEVVPPLHCLVFWRLNNVGVVEKLKRSNAVYEDANRL